MTSGWVRVASTRSFPEQRGQSRTSNPKVRFLITAHSRRLDHANSPPSSRRPQGATEIMIGPTATTGSAGTVAMVSPRTASVGAGAGDAAVGDADADAGAGAAAADVAAGAAPDTGGVAAHGFGVAASRGGFGVTSGRHDDRDAKTPW
jgi:hypothetical protein